jgi:hypothetical protein
MPLHANDILAVQHRVTIIDPARIDAESTVDDVPTCPSHSVERVGSTTAAEGVSAEASPQSVAASSASQHVIADRAVKLVRATTSQECVVATKAADQIVPRTSAEHIHPWDRGVGKQGSGAEVWFRI